MTSPWAQIFEEVSNDKPRRPNIRDQVMALFAAMPQSQQLSTIVWFAGLLGGLSAAKAEYDVEEACIDFIQRLHDLRHMTPSPPTPTRKR